MATCAALTLTTTNNGYWCWAACAQMIDQWFQGPGGQPRSIKQIVALRLGSVLLQQAWPPFFAMGIPMANAPSCTPLTLAQLQAELANRPIVVCLGKGFSGSHLVVVCQVFAKHGTHLLRVLDPAALATRLMPLEEYQETHLATYWSLGQGGLLDVDDPDDLCPVVPAPEHEFAFPTPGGEETALADFRKVFVDELPAWLRAAGHGRPGPVEEIVGLRVRERSAPDATRTELSELWFLARFAGDEIGAMSYHWHSGRWLRGSVRFGPFVQELFRALEARVAAGLPSEFMQEGQGLYSWVGTDESGELIAEPERWRPLELIE